ncbi:MAG: nitroreductase family protein [Acidobacteriota bacterium]|nr:nitroreductase family protein [Blastocatellia bacterium]MDW8238416.1 nitroreductase family protein [Acidobacteriota bacterium]
MLLDFMPLEFERLSPRAQRARARQFHRRMKTRRTVRQFSDEPVPLDLIRQAIETAGTAPSGANQQPWRFIVVANPEVKRQIRLAAEREERENYERRFPQQWKDELKQFGTDWHKEFLEVAPYLIVVFRIDYEECPTALPDGTAGHKKHYYVMESVGIAVGFLLAALHQAGLATLTHTPNPMGFLNQILQRPKNEKPYLLIPVGYPAPEAKVPNLKKKSLDEILQIVE